MKFQSTHVKKLESIVEGKYFSTLKLFQVLTMNMGIYKTRGNRKMSEIDKLLLSRFHKIRMILNAKNGPINFIDADNLVEHKLALMGVEEFSGEDVIGISWSGYVWGRTWGGVSGNHG